MQQSQERPTRTLCKHWDSCCHISKPGQDSGTQPFIFIALETFRGDHPLATLFKSFIPSPVNEGALSSAPK